jgi:hypothetical protein
MINQPSRCFAEDIIPYMIISVAPLCWAGNIVLARGVAETIPPVAFAVWRWTLAFVLILPFALRQLALDWTEITRHWRMLFLLAILGISSFNTLLYTAVHTTTAINGALIQTTMLEQGRGAGGAKPRRAFHQPDPGLRFAALGLAAGRVDPALSYRRDGAHRRWDGLVLSREGIIRMPPPGPSGPERL